MQLNHRGRISQRKGHMEKGSEALRVGVYKLMETQLMHNLPDLSKEEHSKIAEVQTRLFLESNHTEAVNIDLDDTQEFRAIKI